MLNAKNTTLKVACVVTWSLIVVLFVYLIVTLNKVDKSVKVIETTATAEATVDAPDPIIEDVVIPTVVQKSIDICKNDFIARDIANAVDAASKKHHIPHFVIYAIISTESSKYRTEEMTPENFMDVNYKAKSSYDCRGLMQVSKYALVDYNKNNDTAFIMDDLYDIFINVEIGTWYFSQFRSVSSSWVENYVIYNVGYGSYSKINHNWFFGWDGNWYNDYRQRFFYMNDMYPPENSWTHGLYGKNKLPTYRPKSRFEKCLKLCCQHFDN